MAAINLTPVQVTFVNEVVRPQIERIILSLDELDAFILDYDNQQTPIAGASADTLNDGPGGTTARTDAPVLTVQNITNLRTFCGNMRSQVTAAQLNALVTLAVRDVRSIRRG